MNFFLLIKNLKLTWLNGKNKNSSKKSQILSIKPAMKLNYVKLHKKDHKAKCNVFKFTIQNSNSLQKPL